MAQISLFDSPVETLADDVNGRIVYMPAVVASVVAADWFAQLHDGIAWKTGRRLMYEREVDVPRLRAHFSAHDPALPPVLREALAVVSGSVAASFDSLGLNLYRDQHDSVAPHNDKLGDLVKGEPIALLSLGATREMIIREKTGGRRLLRVDMEAGSILVMSWETQLHYDHGIPKQREVCGPRISVAFRVRGQAASPAVWT
jgi:alkylated DNA repair dioxygenase AlkB